MQEEIFTFKTMPDEVKGTVFFSSNGNHKMAYKVLSAAYMENTLTVKTDLSPLIWTKPKKNCLILVLHPGYV